MVAAVAVVPGQQGRGIGPLPDRAGGCAIRGAFAGWQVEGYHVGQAVACASRRREVTPSRMTPPFVKALAVKEAQRSGPLPNSWTSASRRCWPRRASPRRTSSSHGRRSWASGWRLLRAGEDAVAAPRPRAYVDDRQEPGDPGRARGGRLRARAAAPRAGDRSSGSTPVMAGAASAGCRFRQGPVERDRPSARRPPAGSTRRRSRKRAARRRACTTSALREALVRLGAGIMSRETAG